MSSKQRTSGCTLARLVAHSWAAHAISWSLRVPENASRNRQATPSEHHCTCDIGDEFSRKPALADAWLTVDRDEMRAAIAQRARPRVFKQLELRLSADEWRSQPQRSAHALLGAD